MQPTSTNRHARQAGFTLIEIAVIAPILILAITGIVALLINLSRDNLAARAEIDTIHNTNAALDTIEDDVRIASRYLTTTDSVFNDPYGPNGSGAAWDYKGSGEGNRTLILRSYATTLPPRHSHKQPVYVNDHGCTQDVILSNPALTTNIIYFLSDGDLYRRVLTRTDLTTCNPQFQRQSCPPDLASPNAICQANDSLLLSGVDSFDISYFTNAESSNPLSVYTSNDPSALNPAQTIEVDIKIERRLAGRPFNLERTLRVTKLNE